MIEVDPRWPDVVFNTTCLIGPEGLLYRYRKVNPWIPYEVHASPHDIADYPDPLFPVANTAIGRIGCAICYDWLFPEAIRQLSANGAEVLVRVSAYMDPWGATEPMSWWSIVNRCRALENTAFVVAANQGASLRHYPPYLVARREPDRRLRRPHARGSLSGPWRADRRGSDRHHRAASRTRDEARALDPGAPSHGSVSGLRDTPIPADLAHRRSCRATVVRAEPGVDRGGEAVHEARSRSRRANNAARWPRALRAGRSRE